MLSFVCSVGNVPLAAVLWSGGIAFAGVLAFLFADLIVLPIIAIYRKYYGTRVRAADHGADVRHDDDRGADRRRRLQRCSGWFRPGRGPPARDIFSSIHLDYKLGLNLLGVAIFAALFWLTVRRGAIDPVCGMRVDRAKAVILELGGETHYFCSTHCLHTFEADPTEYALGMAHPPIWRRSPVPTAETQGRKPR